MSGKPDIATFIIQRRKLRHWEGKEVFQVCTACPWQSGTPHTILSACLACVTCQHVRSPLPSGCSLLHSHCGPEKPAPVPPESSVVSSQEPFAVPTMNSALLWMPTRFREVSALRPASNMNIHEGCLAAIRRGRKLLPPSLMLSLASRNDLCSSQLLGKPTVPGLCKGRGLVLKAGINPSLCLWRPRETLSPV